MVSNLLIFSFSIFLVVRGAMLATKHANILAVRARLSTFTVGFFVIAVIGILPETFIAVNSALSGVPSFGLGVLFGSNIADLTLVIAVIILLVGHGIRVDMKIIKANRAYPFLILLPIVLGIDGFYSRVDGAALALAGAVFYSLTLRKGREKSSLPKEKGGRAWSVAWLIGSMAMLLVGSHFVVLSATALANILGVSQILIGMLVVGLGTTLPEFLFALQSLRKRDDAMAVGDILGTVLADATVVVGLIAIISPFAFPQKIVTVTGVFMFVAVLLLFYCMYTGRVISRKEAFALIAFWLLFIGVEFFTGL